MNRILAFIRLLGPGLLYAGAAVGVSHLVQSTRAGAGYGFQLVWVLLVVNIIKYPFFEFGARYAASTGNNLIDGYKKIGWWAVGLFSLLTLATMFAIMAAVTIVTAGLVLNVFQLSIDPIQASAIILVITSFILLLGRYRILDGMIKWVIVILALSTLLAVLFAFGDTSSFQTTRVFSWSNNIDIFFLIAFIGWMPAPIDVSVWQSIWGQAKNKELGYKMGLKKVLLDFRIGYIGTIFLALGFLSLGALVMHGSGEEFSPKGVLFAGQLISLYTSSIGSWAYYIIAIAAIATMFSTTLTCLDAYPRVLKSLREVISKNPKGVKKKINSEYALWILMVLSGTILLLSVLKKTMGFMVDLATTISFVTAPVLAIINYLVVNGSEMPASGKPGRILKIFSLTGIILMSAFSLYYLIWKFF